MTPSPTALGVRGLGGAAGGRAGIVCEGHSLSQAKSGGD